MSQDLLNRIWNGEADCRNCRIRDLVLFSSLDEDDFNRIHLPIEDFFFPQGMAIYSAGDSADFMYTIRSGIIKLELESDGNRKIVRLLRRGDVVGIEATSRSQYRHNAVVLEPGNFCKIPIEVVSNLRKHSPSLCEELLSRWDKANAQADEWFIKLRIGSGRQRVLNLLQILAANSSNEGEFILPSGDDFSSMLDLGKSGVSRIIAALKRENVLWSLGNGYYELKVRIDKS